MSIGKRYTILFLLLAGVVVLAGFVIYKPGPCDSPLAYSIGRIDSEFGIATSTFLTTLEKAESVWEEAAGKELFMYKPDAPYTVNLIFDERQQNTIISRQIEEELKNLEGAREEVLAKYDSLVSQYETEKAKFETLADNYEEKLTAYNNKVSTLQQKNVVSPQEIKQLEQEKSELEELQQELQTKQQQVNGLVSSINAIARREQTIVNEYNSTADTYQDVYGQAREFEQGHYTPNEINVYQFNQLSDLRLVLVHEFGHALGINHVDNPQAVMYRLMEHQSLDPIQLTDDDKEALTEVCERSSWRIF